MKPCPNCGKVFARVDTHMRKNAVCRVTPQCPPSTQPKGQPDRGTRLYIFRSPEAASFPSLLQLRPYSHPQSPEEWEKANEDLANTVVQAVLATSTVEENSQTLCGGICAYFTKRFGLQKHGAI